MAERIFKLVENYIYLYHIDKFMVLPTFPETINDNLQARFATTEVLARSAPIQSYSSSGPRSVGFSFKLHRDLMNQINYGASNMIVPKNDDYLDTFINCVQALSVPEYTDATRMVNPPMVAVRIGDQVFIKGVMSNAQLTYELPLVQIKGKTKYAVVSISFDIQETDAYTASYIAEHGSFRGLSTSLERKITALSGTRKSLSLADMPQGGAKGIGTVGGGPRAMAYAQLRD